VRPVFLGAMGSRAGVGGGVYGRARYHPLKGGPMIGQLRETTPFPPS